MCSGTPPVAPDSPSLPLSTWRSVCRFFHSLFCLLSSSICQLFPAQLSLSFFHISPFSPLLFALLSSVSSYIGSFSQSSTSFLSDVSLSFSLSLSALLHSLIWLLAFSLRCLYDQKNNSSHRLISLLSSSPPLHFPLLLFSTLTSATSPLLILSSPVPCLCLFSSVLSLAGV